MARLAGFAQDLGLAAGYRLQALRGRYVSAEQQQQAAPTQVELARSLYAIDFWQWLHTGRHTLWLLSTKALHVNALPMADDAVYSIKLTPLGLLAEPLNHAAGQASGRGARPFRTGTRHPH